MPVRLTAVQLRTVMLPALMKDQGNLCPLCKTDMRKIESKNICVDHSHSTGFIRGVLCRNCNGLEGKVKTLATRGKKDLTYIQWLENLVEYLKVQEGEPKYPYIHPTYRTVAEKLANRNKQARLRRAERKANGPA